VYLFLLILPPQIQLNTNIKTGSVFGGQVRIPRYIDGDNELDDDGDSIVDEPDEIDVYINEFREELVSNPDGYYFCENEGAFIRYRRNGNSWQGTMPDGTLMEFGVTASARIIDASTGYIYRWMLERLTDTNGNIIVYSYRSFPCKKHTNQRYLSKIEYGPGEPPWNNFHFIIFNYETRPDWFEDCRAGFIIRTGKRISEIIIGTQGPALSGHATGDYNGDGRTDYLNRKYRLSYEAHSHWSLLTNVTWVGSDGTSIFPPIVFGYTVANPLLSISACDKIIGSINTPAYVMDNDLVDLIDLNGDGLPDLLKTDQYGGSHRVYLNLGEKVTNGNEVIEWGQGHTVSSTDGLAWNVDLQNNSNAIAHLADMDADGLADLVYKTTIGDVYYFRNQANLDWGPRSKMNIDPESSAPPSPFGDVNVKTADLDFDKDMDIIQSISVGTGVSYRIWFNLNNQKYSKSITVNQASGFMFSHTGVHIADLNGDRVPDILRIRPLGLEVIAGLGYGKFAPLVFVPLPDYTFNIREVEKVCLQDITGDGLVDLVIERAIPGQLWYWINQGNYTLTDRRIISGMPTAIGLNTEIRWADLNGNGTTDLIYSDSSSDPRIQTVDIGDLIGCVPVPNLLINIDNGIGRKTTIEYATSTHFLLEDLMKGHDWPNPLPFPVNVVSKVVVNDGMGNQYVTEFYYHDGYYEGMEKEFRGFSKVEKKEIGDLTAPDLILVYKFNTGAMQEALKGKLLQVEAKNTQDEIFYSELNTWETRKLIDSVTGDGRKVIFPYQSVRTRDILEKGNGTPVQLKWEYEYDNYGNITKKIEHGRLDADWDDERIKEISYTAEYTSGLSKWIINKVVQQNITDENVVVVAQKQNFYDGSLDQGAISKGNLTRVEEWVAEDKYVVSIRNKFDDYGNIITIYDPLYGFKPGHYRDIVYDNLFHIYPIQEIVFTGKENPLSLIFSATYDYGNGMVISSSDFNGFTTYYSYDTFARLTSITKPPDLKHTVEYDYKLAHKLDNGKIINWVEVRQRDESEGDGFLYSRTFYDGLNRELMTRTEGEIPGQIVVSNIVQLNARKLPQKKYLPYFDSGTLDFAEPTFNSGYTEHFYDAIGREIRVNQPEGNEGVVFSTISYEPLIKTFHDEEQTNINSPYYGCGLRFVEDGLESESGKGRLIEVYEIVKLADTGEELDSPVEWKTTYSYDLLDNLLRYIDSQGNQKIIEYDGLIRKTFMNDPDRGHMHYTYDIASNLIKTVDAKGQVIDYTYDGINRLVAEYYGEEEEPSVQYHYDLPLGPIGRGDLWNIGPDENNASIGRNTLGFLSWVQDQSGEEHVSYDERGQEEWVIKRIIETNSSGMRNFCLEREYDSLNRLVKLIYPDRSIIEFLYNSRGLLESIPNIVRQFSYTPSGQNEFFELNCPIKTNFTYDQRLRLSRLQTLRTIGNLVIQDLNYEYDGVSNITGIVDDLSNSTLEIIGTEIGIDRNMSLKFNSTQSFMYDSLYRLKRASNNTIYGSIDYLYDRIGNMIYKNAELIEPEQYLDIGTITYGGDLGSSSRIGRQSGEPPGPHCISKAEQEAIASISFGYDFNGNVVTNLQMNLKWDINDRLSGITSDSKNAIYVYDYKNIRRKKNVENLSIPSQKTSVYYIDQFCEIRDGEMWKYVYCGPNRIALSKILGSPGSYLKPSAFFIYNHLGSLDLVVDSLGAIIQNVCFYPYGKSRISAKLNNSCNIPYKFTGKEQDSESGLHYFDARYYNSINGRFMSHDDNSGSSTSPNSLFSHLHNEINLNKNSQNLNHYSYAINNPVTNFDPAGNKAYTSHFRSTAGIKDHLISVAEFDWGRLGRVINDYLGLRYHKDTVTYPKTGAERPLVCTSFVDVVLSRFLRDSQREMEPNYRFQKRGFANIFEAYGRTEEVTPVGMKIKPGELREFASKLDKNRLYGIAWHFAEEQTVRRPSGELKTFQPGDPRHVALLLYSNTILSKTGWVSAEAPGTGKRVGVFSLKKSGGNRYANIYDLGEIR